tara:strand:- start:186 stop:1133 length:948 start_codon:yes stop_codon:yes gene_type:complete
MYIENPRDGDSEALRKGSALDCMLTEPDKFDERFAVADKTPPGGMMGEFVKVLLELREKIDDFSEAAFEAALQTAYKASGFKTKYETVIKKFETDDIQEYVKFVIDSQSKTILSPNEWLSALGMKEMLLNSDVTKKYLVDLPSNPMVKVFNQLIIIWKHGNFECKSILDTVIIDYAKKQIIPIDIKTTSKGVGNFIQSFIRYGYFRQCSFYFDAVRYWLNNSNDHEIKDPKNWTIIPFKFIVADSNLNDYPLIYRCSEKDLDIGKNGGFLPKGVNRLKGWQELLDELKFYQGTRDWRYSYDQLQQNCEMELDIFE